jgi:hypothetical protein
MKVATKAKGKKKVRQEVGNHRVKVIVRVRPLLNNETGKTCVSIVGPPPAQVVELRRDSEEVLQYMYLDAFPLVSVLLIYGFFCSVDSAYDGSTDQEDFFANEVAPIVNNIFKGINTTIFAYGMTGAGKTFTMQGEAGKNRGIIPRVAEQIMAFIEQRHATEAVDVLRPKTNFCIKLSYLEIYNERVTL